MEFCITGVRKKNVKYSLTWIFNKLNREIKFDIVISLSFWDQYKIFFPLILSLSYLQKEKKMKKESSPNLSGPLE